MQVPYAKKWAKETEALRKIALSCDLVEVEKWGKPCFMLEKKNIAIVIPLKESCAFSFFQGALLKDRSKILEKIGDAQEGRWVKFTSVKEITALRSTLKDYLYETMENAASGKKVKLKKLSDYEIPAELQKKLDTNKAFRTAFEALTPGRQKSYILHIGSAKQSATRAARVEKCTPKILAGRGFLERLR